MTIFPECWFQAFEIIIPEGCLLNPRYPLLWLRNVETSQESLMLCMVRWGDGFSGNDE